MTEPNKEKFKVLVVIPLGPNDNAMDTIESIFLYMDSVRIIVIDDSNDPTSTWDLQKIDRRITVLCAKAHGIRGGLWTNLAAAYKYAVDHFEFEVLLKMDTDALVIGSGSEDEAIAAFDREPDLGMIGSYKIDCNGKDLPRWIPANVIWREAGIRGYKNPERRKLLSGWITLAKKNGYRLGDFVQGGADFQSYACIKTMAERGFLNTSLLATSEVGEDFLFSIITMACGYHLANFAIGDFPLAISWQGLPDSPENLLKRRKKIIHSIKSWEDMDQRTIRNFFFEERKKASSPTTR